MQVSSLFRLGAICLSAAIASLAAAAEPLTNTLTVHRIALHTDGHESLEPAASARPGELLEYVAEFHNAGASTARGLSATLPLPAGTEFISASQRPAGALASVDGVKFEAIPLKRTVREADGLHEVLVPLNEYRFLRWPATELPSGATYSVSARVAVASNTSSSGRQ
jgi:uncharacterized repeat protein (TIGR01451 family)